MPTDTDTQRQRFYARPADRSLQAYKDFIPGMSLALNPNAEHDLTEDNQEKITFSSAVLYLI